MRIRNQSKNNILILVLNSDYLPVNITNFKKAFKLLFKNKAEIIEIEGPDVITSNQDYKRPSVIKLKKYVNVPFRKVVLSRENIFKRDNYTCGYCGSKKNLTVDHIYPKSKGGQNKWENLMTCCFQCNAQKGDKTIEQANMVLRLTPFRPNPLFFMQQSHGNKDKWKQYIMS